jgi:TolA-binding protein
MRRLLTVLIAAAVMAGCQPQSDPELKAALVKIATTPSSAPQAANDPSLTLQPRLDSIRESVREVRDAISGSERKVTAELGAILTRLDAAEKRAGAAEVEATAAKTAAENARSETTQVAVTLASLRTAFEELASKVRVADPERYLEMMREIGEKERQVSQAQVELERAKLASDNNEKQLADLRAEIATLKGEIEQLSGASINRHPDYVALQTRNRDLDRELRATKQEAERLKTLVDTMVAGGSTAPQNGTAPAATPANQPNPASPWAGGFQAEVTNVQFNQETQSHTVLAKLLEGDPPRVGDVLTIIDSDNQKVCDFRVMRLWEEGAFGGSRIDRGPIPAPTVGDKIVRARNAEAQGR